MKLAYIAHPLGAETKDKIDANIRQAEIYAQKVMSLGYIPFVPHWFARILDDRDVLQRCVGIMCANYFLKYADVLFICGDTISNGMSIEISTHKELGKPYAWVVIEEGRLVIREDADCICTKEIKDVNKR